MVCVTALSKARCPGCGCELLLRRVGDLNVVEYRADCRSCGWGGWLRTIVCGGCHVDHLFEWTSESWRCLDCGHVRTDSSPPRAVDFPNLWSVIWFGSDGTAIGGRSRDEAPEQAVHLRILSTYTSLPRTEKFQILNDKHMDMFNYPLDFYVAAGYDVFWAIARAVLEAQSTDPSDVIPLLPSICSDMFGLSGWCELNEAGDR